MPHDIVTVNMSPKQRAAMYDCANRVVEAINRSEANSDTRLVTVALLRVIAANMARSAWGRSPTTIQEITNLLPLYVQSAIQSDSPSRIIQPFSKLV